MQQSTDAQSTVIATVSVPPADTITMPGSYSLQDGSGAVHAPAAQTDSPMDNPQKRPATAATMTQPTTMADLEARIALVT